MERFGKIIVKLRYVILIGSLLLLIPSAIGYFHTRINYDILYYLPDDIETMIGQDILVNDFGTGAFSMVVVEGMDNKNVAALKEKIEGVDHVKTVLWYDSLMDISVPMNMIPNKYKEVFENGDATLMMVMFDTTTSADETMEAVTKIRTFAAGQCFVSGMSSVVTDTKNLVLQEIPLYILIAAVLSLIVLALSMESYFIPVLILGSIGMSIVYNLGSNVLRGEISYITEALTAVLQLAVTMDYSIFLWHSYSEEKKKAANKNEAMATAIAGTIKSVVGSSITTVAGFVALMFMSFTLGFDMGLVMAKGVVLGVISCVTVLPSMILIFDPLLEKTKHKGLIPDLPKFTDFVLKHYRLFALFMVATVIPVFYCYNHTAVYYDLAGTLPKTLDSSQGNAKLEEYFDMGATHMLLIDSSMTNKEISNMENEMENVDGVKAVLSLESIAGPGVPESMIPQDVLDVLKNGDYELVIINSQYKTGTDEVNDQLTELTSILKRYDNSGMLIGEAPCTKDLIEITNNDFNTVNTVSIILVFIIIALVFKSISLPAILVAVIEFGIFINLGIPYVMGTEIPFIASIVVGTIQLGATVDYAILMTNKYQAARNSGMDKKEAVKSAHHGSVNSIFISAMTFFAATFGVGFYSKIDMIGSICNLLSRGAIISLFVALLILPSMLMIFDKVIIYTSLSFKPARENIKKEKQLNKLHKLGVE